MDHFEICTAAASRKAVSGPDRSTGSIMMVCDLVASDEKGRREVVIVNPRWKGQCQDFIRSPH